MAHDAPDPAAADRARRRAAALAAVEALERSGDPGPATGGREVRDPAGHNAAVLARAGNLVAAARARVDADVAAGTCEYDPDATRGVPQPVVCTNVYGMDGDRMRCLRFATTSDAAAFVGPGVRADHVRRAIVRRGMCGRRAFAWLNGREPTERDRVRELDRGRDRGHKGK